MFWLHFTEAAGATNSPILAYHLTHQMLQNILNSFDQSAIQKSTTTEPEIPEITADEKAAIEYIGGYIVRTLIRKISKKNPPNKKEMLYLLYQLLQDPEAQIDEVESNIFSITGWSRIVDRGGLLHGTAEYTHSLVCFEKIIKKIFNLKRKTDSL